jgi:hypothetical protein
MVLVEDAFRNPQSQAGSRFALGGDKWMEEAPERETVHPDPGVGDRDGHSNFRAIGASISAKLPSMETCLWFYRPRGAIDSFTGTPEGLNLSRGEEQTFYDACSWLFVALLLLGLGAEDTLGY